MTYLSATQVKNVLAGYGIKRGKKSSYAKVPVGGVVTTNLGAGWVHVDYSDTAQAKKEGADFRSFNHSMGEIIHFILADMNQFEFRYESERDMTGRHNYFYRKAI